MRLAVLAVLAVLVAGGTAPDVRAEPSAPPTVDHYQVGKRLFERKRYAEAVEAFRLALSVAPRPEVLYSLAQAQRLLGDCTSAVDSYRAFLAGRPDEPLAEYARANIDRCMQADSARRTSPPPWYHDVAGDALVIGGVAAGVAGIVVWRSGHNEASRVADAPDYQAFLDRQASASSAMTYQRLGVAAMVMGATAVIGGIIHYAYRARAPSTDARVGITVIDGGALIAGHARF